MLPDLEARFRIDMTATITMANTMAAHNELSIAQMAEEAYAAAIALEKQRQVRIARGEM